MSNVNKFIATLALGCAALAPALAGTSVGVSLSVVQPGVYGRVDIGSFPQPAVIYPQPVIYAPPPVAIVQQPVYLYVPPGHQKHWGKYCGRYHACGQPVYFVQEKWVRERYEGEHGHGHGHGHDKD
jgi:hypothetical protein